MLFHHCWIHDKLWRTDSDYRCKEWETLCNMLCVSESTKKSDEEMIRMHTSKNMWTAEETIIRIDKLNRWWLNSFCY